MTNGATAAEQEMRAACDLLVAGDIWTAMGYLTPEAINEAMMIGSGIANLPTPSAYEVVSHEEVGAEHAFRVVFETARGPIGVRAVWREVDGWWKVASIAIEEGV